MIYSSSAEDFKQLTHEVQASSYSTSMSKRILNTKLEGNNLLSYTERKFQKDPAIQIKFVEKMVQRDSAIERAKQEEEMRRLIKLTKVPSMPY